MIFNQTIYKTKFVCYRMWAGKAHPGHDNKLGQEIT